jgi:hypothetical protein
MNLEKIAIIANKHSKTNKLLQKILQTKLLVAQNHSKTTAE